MGVGGLCVPRDWPLQQLHSCGHDCRLADLNHLSTHCTYHWDVLLYLLIHWCTWLGNGVVIEALFFLFFGDSRIEHQSLWGYRPLNTSSESEHRLCSSAGTNTVVRVSEGAASLWLTDLYGDRREANDPSLFTSPHTLVFTASPTEPLFWVGTHCSYNQWKAPYFSFLFF